MRGIYVSRYTVHAVQVNLDDEVLTRVRLMRPCFILVIVLVAAEWVSTVREVRVRQYTSWTVERTCVTVVPTYESDLDIRSTGGFRKRQS